MKYKIIRLRFDTFIRRAVILSKIFKVTKEKVVVFFGKQDYPIRNLFNH